MLAGCIRFPSPGTSLVFDFQMALPPPVELVREVLRANDVNISTEAEMVIAGALAQLLDLLVPTLSRRPSRQQMYGFLEGVVLFFAGHAEESSVEEVS